MTASRDATAESLSQFLSRRRLDNPWAERKGVSTRVLYAVDDLYDLDRLDFHSELIERGRASTTVASDGTLAVVVTAGPPGAGKSTAVAAHPEFADFRHIDADDFKDGLLERATADGLLDVWLAENLADGRNIAPRELSTFVHAESTVVANTARQRALAVGENLIVHGTLNTVEATDELLRTVIEAEYRSIRILDVEVDQATATERALSRWWSVRDAQKDHLGGRFIPPAAIALYYKGGSAESTSRRNAEALAQEASDLGFDVDIEVIRGDE